jgi:DNA invertase Pin-like site-specific DNA recombinase
MSGDPDRELLAGCLRPPGPYAEELGRLGERRRAAQAEDQAVLERIEEVLPGALGSGLSLSEVARLTGVSRPTLYGLKRRAGAGRRLEDRTAAGLADAATELGIDLSSSRAR